MGHGDSEGDFEDSSIETRISDIKCAIQMLFAKLGYVKNIGLLGLRFGATLAALVAEEDPKIDHLVLWEPIINGASYMKEMLRINISTQMAVYKEIRYNTEALIQMMKNGKTVNVDGYEMSWPLYEEAVGIDPLRGEKRYRGKLLLLQIIKKEGQVSKKAGELAALYANCELRAAVEEPFWKEIRFYYPKADNLFRSTLDWIGEVK
jgi:pimeloyl-ACP methyl ester carboxylesterase